MGIASMDALGDYGSDEEKEEEEAAPPPAFIPGDPSDVSPPNPAVKFRLFTRLPQQSDDEDDEDESKAEAVAKAAAAKAAAAAKEKESKKRGTSAASALLSATAKPVFLHNGKAGGDFDLPPDQEPAAKAKDEGEPQAKRQAVPPPQAAAPAVPVKAAVAPAADKAGGGKGGKGHGDVKDKVKTQRMRGQSAHQTWKSEGEMKLRQGYD